MEEEISLRLFFCFANLPIIIIIIFMCIQAARVS